MTTETAIKHPSITYCFDDERIIDRMKAVGVWEQMQDLKKTGTTVFILRGEELFIWHDCPTDSGYSLSKSNNRAALLLIMAKV